MCINTQVGIVTRFIPLPILFKKRLLNKYGPNISTVLRVSAFKQALRQLAKT